MLIAKSDYRGILTFFCFCDIIIITRNEGGYTYMIKDLGLDLTTNKSRAKEALRLLRRSVHWQAVSVIILALSSVVFAVPQLYENKVLSPLVVTLMFISFLNPTAPIALYCNIRQFLSERHNPEYKKLVGHKWLISVAGFILATVLWLIFSFLMVKRTGGA